MAVMTPRLPAPPPRRPQKRSRFSWRRPAAAPVGGDHFEGADAVGGQAVTTGEPAQAAPQGVADRAHVGGGAEQRGQPVGGGLLEHPSPPGPGFDSGNPVRGVHLDPVQGVGEQQQGVVGGAGDPMPGGLHRHAQPLLPGEEDGGGDVGLVGRLDGECRVLVHRQVPGGPGCVVGGFAGQGDRAVQTAGEALASVGGNLMVAHGTVSFSACDPPQAILSMGYPAAGRTRRERTLHRRVPGFWRAIVLLGPRLAEVAHGGGAPGRY